MHVVDAPHHRLLRLLRDEGPVSRAELGDRLELTRPRLLAEVERLVAAGLHRRGGHGRLARRPAFHAGRAAPAAAVRRRRPGRQLHRHRGDQRPAGAGRGVPRGRRHPVRAEGDPAPGQRAAGQGQDRRARTSGCDAIGIGVPGPVSFRDGVPVSPPIMPGWDRYPVRELLAREHGCPAVVDNDVNIMAIGERHGGVAHSVDDFLFVKIGTGIGCGIYLAGDVYRGRGRLRRRHRAHPGRRARPGLLLRQRRLPGGAVQRRGAGPRRARRGPQRRLAGAGRAAGRPTARSPPGTSPTAPPRATSPASG